MSDLTGLLGFTPRHPGFKPLVISSARGCVKALGAECSA
jgi:hypothetical protein